MDTMKATLSEITGIDFTTYLLARSAACKLCTTDEEITLTRAEVGALFSSIPELLEFTHRAMS